MNDDHNTLLYQTHYPTKEKKLTKQMTNLQFFFKKRKKFVGKNDQLVIIKIKKVQ